MSEQGSVEPGQTRATEGNVYDELAADTQPGRSALEEAYPERDSGEELAPHDDQESERQRMSESMHIINDTMQRLDRMTQIAGEVTPGERGLTDDLRAQMQETRERLDRIPEGTWRRLGLDYYHQLEQRFDSWVREEGRRAEELEHESSSAIRIAKQEVEGAVAMGLDSQSIDRLSSAINETALRLMRNSESDQEARARIRVGLINVLRDLTEELSLSRHRAEKADDTAAAEGLRLAAASARAGLEIGEQRNYPLYKSGEDRLQELSGQRQALGGGLARLHQLYN